MQASWFWHRTHRLKILPKPQIESYTKGHSKIDSKKKTTCSGRIRHYWKALRNKSQKLYSLVPRTMCWSFSAQHWISKYKNILVIGILHAGNSMNLVYELRGHKGKKYCACTQLAILSIHFMRNFVIKTTCPSACIWPYCLVGLVPLYCRPRYSGILDSYYSGISLSHSLWYLVYKYKPQTTNQVILYCFFFFAIWCSGIT